MGCFVSAAPAPSISISAPSLFGGVGAPAPPLAPKPQQQGTRHTLFSPTTRQDGTSGIHYLLVEEACWWHQQHRRFEEEEKEENRNPCDFRLYHARRITR
jgi:arylamine N-acetyltransferase